MKDLLLIDGNLLSTTFETATRRDPDFVHTFYEALLRRHPETRALFGEAVSPAQQRMLASAVTTILAHLDDPEWLLLTLPALGKEHTHRGVAERMYDGFVTCFIETLSAACGDDWSIDADAHWSTAFTVITTLMMSGSEER